MIYCLHPEGRSASEAAVGKGRTSQRVHELSIAQNIVSAVLDALEQHGGGRVLRVRIRVGDISGVVVDSLEFCYQASIAGTPLAGSTLVAERVPVSYRCRDCNISFKRRDSTRACPDCGGERTVLEGGTELEIVDFEVE